MRVKERHGLWQKILVQKYLLMMVIPGVIVMLVFNFYPIYFAQIAFRSYRITMGTDVMAAPWIGMQHFREFFNAPNFSNVMINTLGISFFKLLIGFPIPIIFAILLNELTAMRFKKLVQTITYLPHFLSWVVVSTILLLWMSDTGFLTNLAFNLGIIDSRSNMLANPDYFWSIAVSSEVWKSFGWNSIIFLAGIASIDQEMFEAARIDGAGKYRQIINITLPALGPVISLMLILAVSGLFAANFEQIFVLRNAVNVSRSEIIDTLVFQQAFAANRYDFATAIGLFRSAVAALLLVSANEVSKRINGHSLF
jgi:putative aldouronate transport system permease protein